MKFNLSALKKLSQKHNLKLLVAFGSQISGKIHKESDLDLAFFPNGNVDEEKLYQDLVHLFKKADIDLINLATTHNQILRFKILNSGKILYEEETGIKSTMEWQSYFDYCDFKKYFDLRSSILDKKIGEMIHG
ncbi:MAG: nucleotidyltransferase domain-containing protein [Candidatus Woesearchaeota archaeon]